MSIRSTAASYGIALSILFCLSACSETGARSSSIRFGENGTVYQRSDLLPEQPPPGAVRLAIGGDSRNDKHQVVPWAFNEAKKRGARAFFFLGDLELTPLENVLFLQKLDELRPVPFYPLMGEFEIETFGVLRLGGLDSRRRVKEFKDRFVKAPGIVLAPFEDQVVYSADLAGSVHLIAMDNVSLEGFGTKQLTWLEEDLKAANAAGKTVLVGMHKALAMNPVTIHAMDEDGLDAIRDSDAALALFKNYKVAMVVVSHSHMYAAYNQEGIEVRLTGGMGAPLVKGLAEADGGFHHFLLVDVPGGENKMSLKVEVIKFQGLR